MKQEKQSQKTRLYERLSKNQPLLFDGAMGTLYAEKSRKPSQETELGTLNEPEVISGIHQAYLEAGAEALKTNTYSLPSMLSEDGLISENNAREIIRQSAALAREAAKDQNEKDVFIFGDLGPVRPEDQENALKIYQNLIRLFLEEGIELFLIETLSGLENIKETAGWLKEENPDAFLMVSVAAGPDGLTRSGKSGLSLIRELDEMKDVDALGFNCMSGPSHLMHLVRDLPELSKPLSVMPNAGYPSIISRRTVYDGSPDYFAERMMSLIHQGVSIVGGCCGTTPEHIAALSRQISQEDAWKKSEEVLADLSESIFRNQEGSPEQIMDYDPGILQKNRALGRKSFLVELDPPANDSISFFLEGVSRLRKAGADMITIADNPIGRPRADSSILACKIKREEGIEVLPHMTCRDRNLNAIKALLLGLSIEDVHHVLLVTGDPLPDDLRNEVQAVYSFNSRTLASFVRDLGQSEACAPFHMLGALDINARNFDVQLRLAKEKEANGMEGFLSQPVFSKRAAENLKRARKELKGMIFGGLMPIVSYKNAMFLANEISGMDIPEELIEKYRGLDRNEAEELAVKTVLNTAEEIADDVDGFYIMTPFKRVNLSSRIIEKISESERQKKEESATEQI